MVDSSVMNLMMEIATLSFVIPVVLVAAWKLRTRKSLIPVFVGAGIFLLFAKLLETIPHTFFLLMDNPVSRVINGNPWLYALYGGLMAALFEEAGRYVAFRYFLNRHTAPETPVSYGLGHGGIECMLVLGIANLQNFTYAQLINNHKMDEILKSLGSDQKAVDAYQELISTLTHLKTSTLIWGGVERVAALFLQVALSVMVFYAVRQAGKIRFLWIAMAIHALVDFVAAFYQAGVVSLLVTELCIIIITIGAVQLAFNIYKALPKDTTKTSSDNWNYAKKRY